MAGIYIHIPFCKQRCTYCDFHFSTRFSKYRSEMIWSIQKELTLRCQELSDNRISTIYFGGGTPSLLHPDELETLIQTVFSNYSVSDDAEITLECNPDDMTEEQLASWKALGINRLSVGLQSFRDKDLNWMNRAHNATEALACIPRAQQSGFQNISVDLIYGLPDLSPSDWKKHIQTVLSFEVQHVSAYCLTVEKQTALQKMVADQKLILPEDDVQGEQFLQLITQLEAAGFEQYEISNFARKGFKSKHNSAYWKAVSYLGVGPSAHSFDGTSRRWNVAGNPQYIKALKNGVVFWERELLSPKERFNEFVMTGLRTTDGIDTAALRSIHLPDTGFEERISEYIDAKWMIKRDSQLILTPEGRLRADHIASSLFLID